MPDVPGVYARFGVRLPDFGDGWATTRCFTGRHQDRHPSARVHLRSGGFRCFACGISGGVLDALQLLGVHDRDEARRLAVDYGILEPSRPRPRPPRPALPGIRTPPVVPPPQVPPPPRPPPAQPVINDGYVNWDGQPSSAGGVLHDRAWEYVDGHGVPVGRVRRLDLDNGQKRIWQERPNQGGWTAGLDGTELPLYRLPQVLEHAAAGRRILVVEGEKACDALDRLGLFATTNAGGAGKWKPQHTRALAGATVTAIADSDLAGRLHAVTVTEELLDAGVTVTMPVDLAGLRDDGYDVVDDLAQLADTIRAVAPDITAADLRDRLRHNLEQQLGRALPATLDGLAQIVERARYLDNPERKQLLDCNRCGRERVHRLSHGLAYCPCGGSRRADP